MDGGKGGRGQDGGDGAASNDGAKCSVPQPGLHEQCVYPNCNPWPYRATATTSFFNLGTIPERGGNGGLGGAGGLGGLAGLARITKLDDSLPDKFVTFVNSFGKPGELGKDGEGGIGGIGGSRYRCTRTFYWTSWRCCKSTCFGICCDYHTCDKSSWYNDLNNDYVPGTSQNGITPNSKNSIGLQPNEMPINSIENLLLHHIEHAQTGSSDFYSSFQNYLEKIIKN